MTPEPARPCLWFRRENVRERCSEHGDRALGPYESVMLYSVAMVSVPARRPSPTRVRPA